MIVVKEMLIRSIACFIEFVQEPDLLDAQYKWSALDLQDAINPPKYIMQWCILLLRDV